MLTTLGAAVVAACLVGLGASLLMTKASNLSPAWNIAIGGMVALTLALALYVLVVIIERLAFG